MRYAGLTPSRGPSHPCHRLPAQSVLPFLLGPLLWVELHPHKKVKVMANPQYPRCDPIWNKAFKAVIGKDEVTME